MTPGICGSVTAPINKKDCEAQGQQGDCVWTRAPETQ